MIKYCISVDIGLKGFITLSKYENDKINILENFKVINENKEDYNVFKIFQTKEKKVKEKLKKTIKLVNSFQKNFLKLLSLKIKYNLDENNTIIVFEQLTSRPFFSNMSSFSIGFNYAVFINICNALNIPFLILPPATWKKNIGVTSDKQTSIDFFKNNKYLFIYDNNIIKINENNDNNIESLLLSYFFKKNIFDKSITQ